MVQSAKTSTPPGGMTRVTRRHNYQSWSVGRVARILYIVWYEVDPSVEAEWDRWMSSTHIPEVVAKGNFLGAKRYVVKEGSPARYATFYEARDPETLQTYLDGPSKSLREDYDRRFGEKTRITRTFLEETYSI